MYKRQVYNDLVACFTNTDPDLMAAQEALWAASLSYANSGGTPEDPYQPCQVMKVILKPSLPYEKNRSPLNIFFAPLQDQEYFDENCTTQDYGSVPIYEPCNYASNVAYYHNSLEACHKPHWNFDQDTGEGIFQLVQSLEIILPFKMHGC